MKPIRDAFNEMGRKRFERSWTGEEIALLDDWPSTAALALFSAVELGAFDRCTSIVAQLQAELQDGQTVVVTTGAHHEPHDVPAHFWRDSAYNGRWQDGGENLAEYLTDRGTSHYVRFTAASTTEGAVAQLKQPKPTRKRGPKPKADWEAYRVKFFLLCRDRGLPDAPDN